jgi:hypothetical protein
MATRCMDIHAYDGFAPLLWQQAKGSSLSWVALVPGASCWGCIVASGKFCNLLTMATAAKAMVYADRGVFLCWQGLIAALHGAVTLFANNCVCELHAVQLVVWLGSRHPRTPPLLRMSRCTRVQWCGSWVWLTQKLRQFC